MFKFFRKLKFKKELLRQLEKEAWTTDLNFKNLQEQASGFEALINANNQQIAQLEDELKKLENDTTKEARIKRQQIEQDIKNKKSVVEDNKKSINNIHINASNEQVKAAQTRSFAEFTKKNF